MREILNVFEEIRVVPDTDLAGYRAINFAGHRISGRISDLAGYRISGWADIRYNPRNIKNYCHWGKNDSYKRLFFGDLSSGQ